MNITRLEPAYKNYIWGGTRLNSEYNKTSPYDITAESWELSCHEDGLCVIADGENKGKTLKEIIAANPDILGKNGKAFDFFRATVPFFLYLKAAHLRGAHAVHFQALNIPPLLSPALAAQASALASFIVRVS